MKKHKQLDIFSVIVKKAHLVAKNSPRRAFYRIWVERSTNQVSVVKESGIGDTILDRRSWPHGDLSAAEKDFCRRLKAKTNPDRKSPRKYRLVSKP